MRKIASVCRAERLNGERESGEMRPPRYWEAARSKVEREGVCRVCGSQFWLQAAHVVGRKFDQEVALEDGTSVLYVDPVDITVLCCDCHRAYDARRLDLLPHLTYSEQAAAVEKIGLVRALHRLTGNRLIPAEMPSA